jgi:ADP-heptose:LPS heptosyltransferase
LIFQKYDKIIIFENDSTLSKILASLPYSNKIVGISNTYRGIFNEYFFDKYFVRMSYIGKIRELDLLDKFKVSQNKLYIENLSQIKKSFIKKNINEILKVKKISIYSESGDQASERKLDVKFLKKTLSFLEKCNVDIKLVFSSKQTLEKSYFSKNLSKHKGIKLIITKSYDDYISIVKDTDLIITADSQTAHLAAFLNKLHIIIFGPSFPYEVSFENKKMYPMSRLLECSPCANRYFKTPCDDKFFCFDFNLKNEEIFNYLKKK